MSEQFRMPHDWPEESRVAAQLVADAFGAPDAAPPTRLVWHEGEQQDSSPGSPEPNDSGTS